MNMWLIVLFLLAGFSLGYLVPSSKIIIKGAELITRLGLIILLTAMGARIGIDERILSQLDRIGLQAFLLALASVLVSILFVKLLTVRLKLEVVDEQLSGQLVTGVEAETENGREDAGREVLSAEEIQVDEDEPRSSNLMTFLIIGSVAAGILLGLFVLPAGFFTYIDYVTTYALAALLFGVGIDIGLNREVFGRVKDLGWQILLIPIFVAVGSILGAVIVGYLSGLSFNEAAAVGAGFGWYSLSGVLLAKLHSVELGSLAFLANVFRELITIISLPLVVRYFGKLTGIAPGGATTMDVTLPLIKETAGEETVIPAFINGVILSTLVPLLVPLLINL